MNFTREQYEEIILVLENDGKFYRQYIAGATYARRRGVIHIWLGWGSQPGRAGQSLPKWVRGSAVQDRDQLRRYFDECYCLPQNEENKYVGIPSVWGESAPPIRGVIDAPSDSPSNEKVLVSFYTHPTPVPSPTKETAMASKPLVITTATFANGADISKLSDGEIFNMIAEQEAEIETLKKIKAQPKKLVAELAARQAGIDALVAHLDSKE